MSIIGFFLGAILATFLVSRLVLLPLPKHLGLQRYVLANVFSGLAAVILSALGAADGGPPNWSYAGYYIAAQLLWFVVDLQRWNVRRERTPEPELKAARGAVSVAAPAPKKANEPSAGELAFWQSISASTDAADYNSYLRQFPTGFFAELARNRLAALGASVSKESESPTQPRAIANATHPTPPQIAPTPSKDGSGTPSPAWGPMGLLAVLVVIFCGFVWEAALQSQPAEAPYTADTSVATDTAMATDTATVTDAYPAGNYSYADGTARPRGATDAYMEAQSANNRPSESQSNSAATHRADPAENAFNAARGDIARLTQFLLDWPNNPHTAAARSERDEIITRGIVPGVYEVAVNDSSASVREAPTSLAPIVGWYWPGSVLTQTGTIFYEGNRWAVFNGPSGGRLFSVTSSFVPSKPP